MDSLEDIKDGHRYWCIEPSLDYADDDFYDIPFPFEGSTIIREKGVIYFYRLHDGIKSEKYWTIIDRPNQLFETEDECRKAYIRKAVDKHNACLAIASNLMENIQRIMDGEHPNRNFEC